ncbi:hypothetical protein ELG69_05270 [Rhizobium leguminosarum]|uniref:restriction endonuclease subunit S n=1 Tax=Rhizobium leguminosarum TaxID=384 RepID=UPI00103214C3|nr:restriction endonuclease subunit S [Rhizobium leguminosarum]TBG83568.1 hypothetical protein ELG69_05270 [Rhizobium leguminosarum]
MNLAPTLAKPAIWPRIRLGELADHRLGKMLDKQKNTGLPRRYLRNPNIRWFDVDLTDLQEILVEEQDIHRYELRDGDVLICEGGEAGRAAIWKGDSQGIIFQKACHRVRVGPNLDARFLVHRLMFDYFNRGLDDYYTGATIKHFTGQDLARYEIPLPPLDERIAAILDKADQLRQKRRQAIAMLDSLTQSIFLEMFGDLIENDKSFAAGRISDWVEDFETGKNLAPDPDNSDPRSYRVLKVSAVTSGIFKAEEAKALPKSYRAPLNHLIHKGDLLFSRANTAELIGATAIVHTDYERIVLPDKIWRFAWNAKNKPNPLFVHGMFSSSSFRGEISKRATGTSGSMKNISKEKVLNIRIGMPERQLQDDFAERIEATQRCRLKCENQLTVLEAHFSSLQHRAFSGQL